MGQRGNYIIQDQGRVRIFYTHWRASLIAKDLMLGSTEFINFVERFEERDSLIHYPWIEGFVFINKDKRKVIFSEDAQLYYSSVLEEYLIQINQIWKGWEVSVAKNGLYFLADNIEPKYISSHTKDFDHISFNSLENANSEYLNLVSIVKNLDGHVTVNYFNAELEGFLLLGPDLLGFLKNKEDSSIANELEVDYQSQVFFDERNNKIIIGEGIPLLKESLEEIWKGWKIEIMELGYLHMLSEAGIDTSQLKLRPERVISEINEIKRTSDNFDPNDFSKNILEDQTDVKFHPNFFENIKPQKMSWIQKLINRITNRI